MVSDDLEVFAMEAVSKLLDSPDESWALAFSMSILVLSRIQGLAGKCNRMIKTINADRFNTASVAHLLESVCSVTASV